MDAADEVAVVSAALEAVGAVERVLASSAQSTDLLHTAVLAIAIEAVRRRRRGARRARSRAILDASLRMRTLEAEQFRREFRLTPPVFDALVRRLAPALARAGPLAERPEVAVLLTLHRLGSRALLRPTGAQFGLGTTTVHRLFWRTVDAINEHVFWEVVAWPSGDAELAAVRAGFAVHGLSNVVGAIDCTHVGVHPPVLFSNDYLDRTRQHSVIAQAVVDHTGRFRDVYAGCVGSMHDMAVFKASSLYARILRGSVVTEKDYIVADSGYWSRSYIVPPFDRRGQVPTPMETAFNVAHAQTRGIVERAFGQLKERYRILLDHVEGHADQVHKVITACMALHNFGLMNGEPAMDPSPDALLSRGDSSPRDDSHASQTERQALQEGRARRDEAFRAWQHFCLRNRGPAPMGRPDPGARPEPLPPVTIGM